MVFKRSLALSGLLWATQKSCSLGSKGHLSKQPVVASNCRCTPVLVQKNPMWTQVLLSHPSEPLPRQWVVASFFSSCVTSWTSNISRGPTQRGWFFLLWHLRTFLSFTTTIMWQTKKRSLTPWKTSHSLWINNYFQVALVVKNLPANAGRP